MPAFRVFNEWQSKDWKSFVPFCVYWGPDFYGFVLFNFNFEFPLSETGKRIHASIS